MWLVIVIAVAAAVAVLALGLIFGVAGWVAHSLTVLSRYEVWGHPSEFGLHHEDVAFPSRRDKVLLKGWYLPAPEATCCIVLAPGEEHHRNSPGIQALSLGNDLVQQGFSVLLFDYRGRGESGGKRNSAGDREQWDLLGAIDYVEARGFPVERIGLIGFSLGAAVATLVAAREPRLRAVVSDSGFLDYIPYLRRVPFYFIFLPSWFVVPIVLAGKWLVGADFSKVRPVKVVASIAPRPIFFIHGANDRVVPVEETVELHKAANNPDNPLWIIPNSGHIRSYARQSQEYVARVTEFFRQHLA
ncbi:MAG: alpha/beta fold hydrolase [SAR202 cluster bacterium]|nr:alpha/beta fold hydrolase [SAR202 cluster bacterium]